jgi:NAD(P)-dependent dehydrogenase (short-subunit alcohol dehydrogenase family)
VKDLGGRVAVVTGAASGIGRSLATRLAAEGMKVMLADVDGAALRQTAAELAASGANVAATRVDVTRAAAEGLDPARVAELVVDAIRRDRFHILTHPERSVAAVAARERWLVDGIPPEF